MKRNSKIVFSVVVGAFLLQLLIVSYNHYTGFIRISGMANLLVRLFIGTAFSSLFGAAAIFVDLQIIRATMRLYATDEPVLRRLWLTVVLAVLSGCIIGAVLTLVAHLLLPYKEPLVEVLRTNIFIVAVVNVIISSLLEAFLLYRRNRAHRRRAEQLERENLRLQLETLKKQLDPHFLFNSLNVLSSLVAMDAGRAQEFIDEFSSVYRYTLSAIDRPVVSLAEELEYVRSYLYLQSIRFSEGVITDLHIDQACHDYLLPPLAVQTLLENAFKHNQATREAPLAIRIYTSGERLVVENSINRKLAESRRKGLGLHNLLKRYELVCESRPEISATATTFTVILPLQKPQ